VWDIEELEQRKTHVVEHAPKVFQALRTALQVNVSELLQALGLRQLLGNLLMGNNTTLRAGLSEAKSGSFFFQTHDGKYILKTIGKEEFDLLLHNLESYWGHMAAYPKSLMTHFFGLYEIWTPIEAGGEPVRLLLVLMNNVFYHPQLISNLNARYDLKGAKFLRASGMSPENGNLLLDKDCDEYGTRLALGDAREGFLNQLAIDTQWLASCDFYDYSLLVGIYRLDMPMPLADSCEVETYRVLQSPDGSYVYLLGVIDCLTEFNVMRQVQRTVQTIITLGLTEVSAAPPDIYASRLTEYITTIVD